MLAIAAGAVLVAVLSSRTGIGISTDSVAYLAEARAIRNGDGPVLPAGLADIYAEVNPDAQTVASAHFPPLYPALLALTGDQSAAREVNAVLLAVTAAAVALIVRRYTASTSVATVAAGLVALAPAVLRIHAMAWSEPLFIALAVWGALALAAFLNGGRPWTLVAGGLLIGGAWLTRHVGIALVFAGFALILRSDRPRWTVLWLALSAVPMTVFLAVTTTGGYTVALHAPPDAAWRDLVETARHWFSPAPFLAGLAAAIVACLLVGRSVPPAGRGPRRLTPLPRVLAAFLAAYAVAVLASLVVFREYVPLEERLAVPAYALVVPLAACTLTRARAPLAAFAGATVVAGTALLLTGVHAPHDFTARPWTSSEAIQEVRSLPPGTPVWSNFPEAIAFHTGRPARLLPRQVHAAERLLEDLRFRNGLVVVFTTVRRPGLVEPAGLPSPVTLADARIYRCGAMSALGCPGAGPPAR